MKISGKDYAVGQTVPADVVAKAAPLFHAAAEAARKNEFSEEARKLADPFTILGVIMYEDDEKDWNKRYENEQKRLKAAAKRGEILVFGGKYLSNKKLVGQYFVAKCNGLARKRHPEADDALRIQDAEYSYDTDCTLLYTRDVK